MNRPSKHLASLLRLFPVPKYLTFSPVGIDISHKVIRALSLKRSKYGLVPDKYQEVILDEVCDLLESNDDLHKCDSLRKALQKLKKDLGLKFVSVSLPETKTYIFKTTIPVEAVPTIEDALTTKIQENVPLEMKDVIFDFILRKDRILPNGNVEVVVTVLPKNVIDAYTTLLEEEGMIPISFESESQSIARAIIKHDDDTPYLLINLGYTRVNLTIVEHGIVHYTSSIPYPSEEIVKDFEGKEAQALKTKINQLLVYWFTNKNDPGSDDKISNAILTGPFASSSGMIQFLERSLRINVKAANVWENCFDLDKHIPEISHEESLRYGTSIGLSLIHK